jgi:hypothetical protein
MSKKAILYIVGIFLAAMLLFLWTFQEAFAANVESVEITAEDTFTTPKKVNGEFSVWITDTDTMDMTITLQGTVDKITWTDTGDSWSAAGVYPITDGLGAMYRVGCKAGDYTSGTAIIYLITK